MEVDYNLTAGGATNEFQGDKNFKGNGWNFGFLAGARQLRKEESKDYFKPMRLPPGSANFYARAWEQSNGEEQTLGTVNEDGTPLADRYSVAYWQKKPTMPGLRPGTDGTHLYDPNDDYETGIGGTWSKKMLAKGQVGKHIAPDVDGVVEESYEWNEVPKITDEGVITAEVLESQNAEAKAARARAKNPRKGSVMSPEAVARREKGRAEAVEPVAEAPVGRSRAASAEAPLFQPEAVAQDPKAEFAADLAVIKGTSKLTAEQDSVLQELEKAYAMVAGERLSAEAVMKHLDAFEAKADQLSVSELERLLERLVSALAVGTRALKPAPAGQFVLPQKRLSNPKAIGGAVEKLARAKAKKSSKAPVSAAAGGGGGGR